MAPRDRVSRRIGGTWTLLSNHGAVLLYLAEHPRATLKETATATGLTERTAFRIAKDLREAGHLRSRKSANRAERIVELDIALSHPIANGRTLPEIVIRLGQSHQGGGDRVDPPSFQPTEDLHPSEDSNRVLPTRSPAPEDATGGL